MWNRRALFATLPAFHLFYFNIIKQLFEREYNYVTSKIYETSFILCCLPTLDMVPRQLAVQCKKALSGQETLFLLTMGGLPGTGTTGRIGQCRYELLE